MANGFSVLEMLDRIEQHILRVEAKVDHTNVSGCALKPEHDRRLKDLEGFKMKALGGIVVSLLAAIGTMATAIATHLFGGR